MLQSFRAKSLAASAVQNDRVLNKSVVAALSVEDTARAAEECVALLRQSDPARSGALAAQLIRRRLQRGAGAALSAAEVGMLVQSLPRTRTGLCMYEAVREVLYDVRFSCMKTAIVEAQGSDVAAELTRRFKQGTLPCPCCV